MENVKFYKPVIDLNATGKNIKNLRKSCGLSVRNIQDVFGFEYPQAVYAWEQGKNVPSIDNLLVLSKLFDVAIDEIVITQTVEVELSCSEEIFAKEKSEKSCGQNCEKCKLQKSA